ncbi:MAG: redox-regulated ATPase YchF [Faecalibacterium sp.]
MKLGIVGLPNVGKSTLFNAITSTKNAEAANYPFCTIEPNSGIVAVPDKRLDKLAEIWQTNKKTPAIVEFVDIAGLVKGASQGAGLGNKFLGHIRECDAIVHVVRCFDDDNIIHVVEDVTKAEAVDPIADIDAIDYELILSDLEVVQNRAGRMAKAAKSGNNKGAAAEAAWLQKLADHLSAGKPARSFDFDEGDAEQQAVLHEMGLLSSKPVLYACNVGEDDLMEGIENNTLCPAGGRPRRRGGGPLHSHLRQDRRRHCRLLPEEKKAFLAEMGIEASGLDNLITASYDLLGLISFLTDGKKECRAWTIRKGTKAPQAAGKIHSDFERGFIRASVIGYGDLEANNFDYAAVKAKGLQRTEGKEYVVKDGDVIEFLFNV